MEFLSDYGLFLAKAITWVVCIGIVMIIIFAASQRSQKQDRGQIEVTKLNDLYDHMSDTLKHAALNHEEWKQELKSHKKKEKEEKSAAKKSAKQRDDTTRQHKKRVFVVDFDGDIKASAADHLREEITAILTLADETDEVVVKLESTGGMVHSYGFAASQLQRIVQNKVPLTICVDKVAASGGYMMACVGKQILAAPFAVIGSIGVVGSLPNFNRLLKKHDIDYEMQTAGEYKRTLTIFGENTDKARQKFAQELEETHGLFKSFILENRPQLDVSSVATGETWYGIKALEKQLIDSIQTSDEYLTGLAKDADVFEIKYQQKKSIPEKLGISAQAALDRVLLTWWERVVQSKFFS